MHNVTAETLDLFKGIWSNPIAAGSPNDPMAKSFTTGSGLNAYDLQPKALQLYPVITPLRNKIPRIVNGVGTATNWKAITGINTGHMALGISEGNRGGIPTTTTANYMATYKSFGMEDNVTFEADYASQGFDDVKALAVEGLLRAVMIDEEELIIGGNSSLALGVTPTPSLVASGAGSSLTNVAYTVQAVALTRGGFSNGNVTGGILGAVTRTNADGSTDTYGGGSAQISAAATVTPGAGQNITATVAAVPGAVGYGWFWGTGGSVVLGAITSTSQVVITAAATGSQPAATLNADNSRNPLAFDGLITQITSPNSGSYYSALAPGATLTSDGAGGVNEINTALEAFWDNYRLSPDLILVNSQELKNITKKVIGGGGAPLFRFNETGGGNSVTAGGMVKSYFNPFSMSGGSEIEIMLHPNVPAGTIIFMSKNIPYPLSNVQNVLQMKLRRDYYQIEWPLRSRRYEYGVYFDGVMQNYFPPAFGMITNITNG
jgi:hypothetical protein